MMKVEKITGRAIPLPGNDIDTDRIIPARFMKCVSFEGLGEYAFYDARFTEEGAEKQHPFNDKKYKGGEILLVNKNFGCGSSREHAPQALQKYGITAIIGESFAEIFAGNCTMMGIPTVSVTGNAMEKLMNWAAENPLVPLEIDLRSGKIGFGLEDVALSMPEAYRKTLLDGTWDSTALLLQNRELIEQKHTTLPY